MHSPHGSTLKSTTPLLECPRRHKREREKEVCWAAAFPLFSYFIHSTETTNAAALNSLVKRKAHYNAVTTTNKQANTHNHTHKQTQPQPHNHTHRNKHNHSRNMLAQSSHSSVTLLGATRTPRLSAHLKYVCPPTVPSFLPTGSSSSTPQRGMFFVACLP